MNAHRISAHCICLVLLVPRMFGQYQHFEKLYGGLPFGHVFADVAPKPDGNVLVSSSVAFGGFGLGSFSYMGQPQWFWTGALGPATGAGLALKGNDSTFVLSSIAGFGLPMEHTTVLSLFNGAGSPQWTKSYLAPDGAHPLALRIRGNDGYLLSTAGSIAQLSDDGSVVWWRNFQARFADADWLSDTTIVVAGSQGLSKHDAAGNVMWSIVVGPDPAMFQFQRLFVLGDSVIACGSGSDAFWLASFDGGSGAPHWIRSYALPSMDTLAYRAFDIDRAIDGLILKVEVVDAQDPQAYNSTFVLRTDLLGVPQWCMNFAQADELMGTIAADADGSCLVASAYSIGASALFRIDVNGMTGCFEQVVPLDTLPTVFVVEPSQLIALSDSVEVQSHSLTSSTAMPFAQTLCSGTSLHLTESTATTISVRPVPVPSEGMIELVASAAITVRQVAVYTPDGRLVHVAAYAADGRLDLHHLQDGAYVLEVRHNKGITTVWCVLAR